MEQLINSINKLNITKQQKKQILDSIPEEKDELAIKKITEEVDTINKDITKINSKIVTIGSKILDLTLKPIIPNLSEYIYLNSDDSDDYTENTDNNSVIITFNLNADDLQYKLSYTNNIDLKLHSPILFHFEGLSDVVFYHISNITNNIYSTEVKHINEDLGDSYYNFDNVHQLKCIIDTSEQYIVKFIIIIKFNYSNNLYSLRNARISRKNIE